MIQGTKYPALKTGSILIFLLFIFPANSNALEANEKYDLEILFIGSSYFNNNNLPDLVYEIAKRSGMEVYIDSYIPSGLYLDDHASNINTEEKIKERKWDFIVLQGVGSIMAYPDYYTAHPVYPALVSLKAKILDNCASTRIIYCLPWAYEDGMTWLGWPDTYEDMQLKIYNRTIEYSNEIGFTIAPVGWAWKKVLSDKEYPLHYLHLSDWNHPSTKGSYIMACVIYSTITVKSTIDNVYYGYLTRSEASYFQEVSSDIVLNDTILWKITSYIDTTSNADIIEEPVISTISDRISRLSSLDQNYPNPFGSVTNIPYSIDHNSLVEIHMYDIYGRWCSTLLKEYKAAGTYDLTFRADALPEGVYFCIMRTDSNTHIRKMQVIR